VTPAAWYPDPYVPGQLRWWDGSTWTAHTAAGPGPAAVATGAATTAAAPKGHAVAIALVAAVVAVALVATTAAAHLAGPQRRVAAADPGLSDRASAAGVPLLDREGAVTHTHTLLRTLVDGAARPVPAGIGLNPATGQIAAVHTHDRSGIVHVESPRAHDAYTVGQFLELWGAGGDDDEVCATFVAGPCAVTVVVVTPTDQDRALFADYGPMPATAAVDAADLDTELAQGAVIEVRLSTRPGASRPGDGGDTTAS
jgi:hypothetical protein